MNDNFVYVERLMPITMAGGRDRCLAATSVISAGKNGDAYKASGVNLGLDLRI